MEAQAEEGEGDSSSVAGGGGGGRSPAGSPGLREKKGGLEIHLPRTVAAGGTPTTENCVSTASALVVGGDRTQHLARRHRETGSRNDDGEVSLRAVQSSTAGGTSVECGDSAAAVAQWGRTAEQNEQQLQLQKPSERGR
ncbi:hypothetical protein AXG93_815s1030 [Marchantia polymorpha subsp. ruderalis]|uniref:Uncharacterized protein n=1 Tax=Marchantia polymorpha subsp. ruderalis TaxID=1480154 RepID=A0A176W1X9_MARPO|nr:hypothetical protein AXG93_815s1030 [Marchantia polymorpha subsp. ruderalis]